MGQLCPGKPSEWSKAYKKSPCEDTAPIKRIAFQNALDILSTDLYKNTEIENVYFPYLIGCGLAGGNWSLYFKMLEQFSSKTHCKVFIIKF